MLPVSILQILPSGTSVRGNARLLTPILLKTLLLPSIRANGRSLTSIRATALFLHSSRANALLLTFERANRLLLTSIGRDLSLRPT